MGVRWRRLLEACSAAVLSSGFGATFVGSANADEEARPASSVERFEELEARTATGITARAGMVAVGRRFSFYQLPNTGSVLALGANQHGQLGIGTEEDAYTATPVAIPGDPWVVSIAAGPVHALFLTEDGDVWATGWNRFGQLADASLVKTSVPKKVMSSVQAIATGYGHSLFLMAEGTVQSVGLNNAGQLGIGSRTPIRTPMGVMFDGGSASIDKIAAGYDFSYFVGRQGFRRVFLATGQNLGGQLGDGTKTTRLSPVEFLKPGFFSSPFDIAAGETHGLYMLDNEVYGMGSSVQGQLGGGIPEPGGRAYIRGFSGATALFAGRDNSCAIKARRLHCTGSNIDGQLGLGKTEFQNETIEYDDLFVRVVALGDSHSFVQKDDYTDFQAAGSNDNGECGNGPSDPLRSFTPFGLDLITSSTSSITMTTSTSTATSTTVTITSIRQIAGDQDNVSDDAQMMQMLQVLMLMGVVAISVGAVIRRFTDQAGGAAVETPEVQEMSYRAEATQPAPQRELPDSGNNLRPMQAVGTALSVVQEAPTYREDVHPTSSIEV